MKVSAIAESRCKTGVFVQLSTTNDAAEAK
jgi:hypothetical protein